MAVDSPTLPSDFMRSVENSDLPPAVVLGTGATGLSIARALRRHGVPVLGLDVERVSYTSYSRAFDFLAFDDFYDPAVIDFLVQVAAELQRKPLLFCSGDEHVMMLSRHGERLHESYRFEIPDADTVDVLMNKNLFAEAAERRGWPVPGTYYVESMADLDAAIGTMEFPVILKPRLKNRQARTHSPQKTFRCATAEDLRDAYRLLAQWEKEAIIQQWIPGGDDEIYFSFHYFNSDMQELAQFEGRKIRQHLPECGSTSCAVGVERPRVTELSREILTEMRSVGFCSVEYKRDPRTGRYYIMEPTVGRVNLQVGVAIANGMDIVSRAYFHLADRPLPQQPPVTHHVKWVLLPQDLRSARFYVRRGEITWRDYFRSVTGPRVIAPFARSDHPLLRAFLVDLGARALRWGGRRLGRVRRPEAPSPAHGRGPGSDNP